VPASTPGHANGKRTRRKPRAIPMLPACAPPQEGRIYLLESTQGCPVHQWEGHDTAAITVGARKIDSKSEMFESLADEASGPKRVARESPLRSEAKTSGRVKAPSIQTRARLLCVTLLWQQARQDKGEGVATPLSQTKCQWK